VCPDDCGVLAVFGEDEVNHVVLPVDREIDVDVWQLVQHHPVKVEKPSEIKLEPDWANVGDADAITNKAICRAASRDPFDAAKLAIFEYVPHEQEVLLVAHFRDDAQFFLNLAEDAPWDRPLLPYRRCGFNTFRGRSAFADIAKAMGVSEYQVRRRTERIPCTDASHVEEAVAYSPECRDGIFEEDPYRTALRLAHRLDGFPRYPKMHPCGVVLSRLPVTHLSPVFTSAKGYPATHFDMEQVEAIGLVKIDILAQAGLAVMRYTKELLRKRGVTVDLKALEPWEDKEVWKMIASGNARGVHHFESPAMCTLERMVNVNNIDDLIAIVSVIRPGAANSMRKESFANRAQGIEPVEYAHPSLEPLLRSTYGVVAYEEHILQICEAFAGMPAGRADFLRRWSRFSRKRPRQCWESSSLLRRSAAARTPK
jgi:Bacterial DNA polymerase III alpha subunit finger domain/Bacterial DNA polymerase III alpha NTPase domain